MTKYDSRARKEEISLRQVFSVEDFPNIEKSENPDFIIHAEDGDFGVEITEYYQDAETSGYYTNDKQYMSNILDDENNIRSKDRGKLERVTIGIGLGDNSPQYWQNMVYRRHLSPPERLRRLDEVIDAKVKSFKHYDHSLRFIDLVVHDQGDLFGGKGGREIRQYLLELSQRALKDMPFRKIYISRKIGVFDKPITLSSTNAINDKYNTL